MKRIDAGEYEVCGHSNDPDGQSSIELCPVPVEYDGLGEPIVAVVVRVPLNAFGFAAIGTRVRVVLEEA